MFHGATKKNKRTTFLWATVYYHQKRQAHV